VHGITLISGLRLGLLSPLRARAYHQFVSLPLYQDMAPWNIVFLGPRLDYIDYDTRDKTYDKFVPKAYEVMEVLFNYKRTVEDFKKCNGKAGNPYNFPFVSDCVASQSPPTCKDSARPVPCGDGTCRSDYVSCLRAISESERSDLLRQDFLWAFRSYADAQRKGAAAAAKRAEDGEDGEDAEDGASDAADSALSTDGVTAAPARDYISVLFGPNDRSAGTASDTGRKEDGEDGGKGGKKGKGKGAGKGKHGGQARRSSTRLSAGYDLLAAGGSLEYNAEGVRRPR
jgi:hypothetical protein